VNFASVVRYVAEFTYRLALRCVTVERCLYVAVFAVGTFSTGIRCCTFILRCWRYVATLRCDRCCCSLRILRCSVTRYPITFLVPDALPCCTTTAIFTIIGLPLGSVLVLRCALLLDCAALLGAAMVPLRSTTVCVRSPGALPAILPFGCRCYIR